MVDFAFQKVIISRLDRVPRPFAPNKSLESLKLWKSVKQPDRGRSGRADFGIDCRTGGKHNLHK
jgi:hypothetical protein